MHALTRSLAPLPHAPAVLRPGRAARAGQTVRRHRHRHAPPAAASSGGAVVRSERVSAALRGTVVFVVGDNAAANAKLCDALATSLGCA